MCLSGLVKVCVFVLQFLVGPEFVYHVIGQNLFDQGLWDCIELLCHQYSWGVLVYR